MAKTILERETERRRRKRSGRTSPERVRRVTTATVKKKTPKSPEARKQTKATVTRTKRKTTDVQRRPRGGASPASKANQEAYRRFMKMTPAQRKYVIGNATKRSAR